MIGRVFGNLPDAKKMIGRVFGNLPDAEEGGWEAVWGQPSPQKVDREGHATAAPQPVVSLA